MMQSILLHFKIIKLIKYAKFSDIYSHAATSTYSCKGMCIQKMYTGKKRGSSFPYHLKKQICILSIYQEMFIRLFSQLKISDV